MRYLLISLFLISGCEGMKSKQGDAMDISMDCEMTHPDGSTLRCGWAGDREQSSDQQEIEVTAP